jgi:molybdate transport system regulatory protein
VPAIDGGSTQTMSLKVRVRIDFDNLHAVGPGKIALLERMRDCGSLSQAARELNMSYRRAWQLLDSLNTSFNAPVIVTSVGGKGGGGSEITKLGLALVDTYRALEKEMTMLAQQRFKPLRNRVAPVAPAARRPVTKAARGKRVRVSKRT